MVVVAEPKAKVVKGERGACCRCCSNQQGKCYQTAASCALMCSAGVPGSTPRHACPRCTHSPASTSAHPSTRRRLPGAPHRPV